MNQPRLDITDRRDVACFVNVFYDRVRDDDLLGSIFDDIAHVDWVTHLPRMYDFWESVLFASATFKGTPLSLHRDLARRAPLTGVAFDRWIALFQSTIDDLFSGPMAEHAKNSATRIAAALEHNIGSTISPVAASSLRDHKEVVGAVSQNESDAIDVAASDAPLGVRHPTRNRASNGAARLWFSCLRQRNGLPAPPMTPRSLPEERLALLSVNDKAHPPCDVIDEASSESFPASDPPSSTLGLSRRLPALVKERRG